MIIKYELEMDKDRLPVLVKDKEYSYPGQRLNAPLYIADMLDSCLHMCNLCEEHVYLVCTNYRMTQPIYLFEISHGTVNCSQVSAREVIQRALLAGASSFILAHNHPSGETDPSKEDQMVSAKIKEAAELMDLNMADFIIVGNGYYSFRENNLLE